MASLRKVQLTGSSTLSVSLPSDWTKRYKVHRGTEVRLVEGGDGSLLVKPASSGANPTEWSLDLGEFHELDHLRRAFLAAYLSGTDLMRFHSAQKISAAKRRLIVDQAHKLIGVEVTEETPNLIIVQDFFSREGLSVVKTLKRAHTLTCSMFEGFLENLEKGDSGNYAELMEKEDDVDRLRFLLLRQLNLALENATILNELGVRARDCINYAIVVRNVEGAADKISVAAQYHKEILASHLRPAGSKDVVAARLGKVGQEAFSLYQQAAKAFLTRDPILANSTVESQSHLADARVDFERLLNEQRGRLPTYKYSAILDSLMDIGEHAADMAEAAIDSSYQEKK